MRRELFFIMLFLVLPILGWAQESNQGNDQNQQSQNSQNTLLPDINPQDIEIRGNFKANFPGLRRQPILGFNPTPPVFRLSSNRIPFMESPDEALVSIPMSKLEATIAPPRTKFTYPHPSNISGFAGVGNHVSPEGTIYAGIEMTPRTQLAARVHYNSTDGFYTGQNDSYRNMNMAFDLTSHLSNESLLKVGVTGLNDFNYLPMAQLRNGYGGMGLNIGYENAKNAWNSFTVNAHYDYFQLQQTGFIRKDNENVLEGDLSKSWEGPAMNSSFVVGINGRGSQYKTIAPNSQKWYILNPFAGYRWRIGYAHGIDLKVKGYYASDVFRKQFYVYPDLTYHYWGIDNMTLTLNLKGDVTNPAMKGHYMSDGFVLPDMTPLNERDIMGRAGIEYQIVKGASISVGYNYWKYYSYLYVGRDNIGIYHMYQDNNTRMWRGSVGFKFDMVPEKFTLVTEFYLQHQTLSDGNDVPFMEKNGFSLGFQVHPLTKLYIKAWVNYLGKRPYGFNGSLASVWLPGGRAEYRITDKIGVYVKSTNVLNQTYRLWPDYKEMPVQIFGGITFKW